MPQQKLSGMNSLRLLRLLLAIKEASRCLLCHDAPCSQACLAQTDPGEIYSPNLLS